MPASTQSAGTAAPVNQRFSARSVTQLLSLSFLSFALGMSQFLIVGMLPSVARGLNISPERADDLTLWYALGICAGLVLLPLARIVPARPFMGILGGIILAGNLLTFALGNWAPGSWGWLLLSRFVAGLPHGTFFGADSLLAPRLAPRGKEGEGLSIVVTGQTVANIIGVPLGAALASTVGWANVYLVIVAVAAVATVLAAATLPQILIIDRRRQKKGVVATAIRHAPFWVGLVAIYLGAVGFFTWYNNVSSWAVATGGFTSGSFTLDGTTWMLALAGLGMFVGSVLSGRLVDRWSPAQATAFGLVWETIALLLVGLLTPLVRGKTWLVYALVLAATCSLFYVSGTPAQLVANDLSAAGLTGGVVFNVAVNAGNFTGTLISGLIVGASGLWGMTALVGSAIAALSVILFIYLIRVENRHLPTLTTRVEGRKIR